MLYIDDLDRCPPAKVVDVLQAVHLLLCFPLFVVVVAVDARWVSRALHDRFPGLLAESAGDGSSAADPAVRALPFSGASSDDYLEKIFQIPYWVGPWRRAKPRTTLTRLPVAIGRSNPCNAYKVPLPTLQWQLLPAIPFQRRPPPNPGPAPPPASIPGIPSPNPRPFTATPIEQLAIPMTLSDWEVKSLNAFAPYIGRTPRHAIRFVNIYRLIKTSLSLQTVGTIDLELGATAATRTLIPQLAIVTGAPYAARQYFRHLATAAGDQSVKDFCAQLPTTEPAGNWRDDPVISGVFATLIERETLVSPPSTLTVKDLLFMAPIVQRYSFAARLQSSPSPG